jgi:hypothetical protein
MPACVRDKLACFQCRGYGYFNAYDLAARYDLDFWVGLKRWTLPPGTAISQPPSLNLYLPLTSSCCMHLYTPLQSLH